MSESLGYTRYQADIVRVANILDDIFLVSRQADSGLMHHRIDHPVIFAIRQIGKQRLTASDRLHAANSREVFQGTFDKQDISCHRHQILLGRRLPCLSNLIDLFRLTLQPLTQAALPHHAQGIRQFMHRLTERNEAFNIAIFITDKEIQPILDDG